MVVAVEEEHVEGFTVSSGPSTSSSPNTTTQLSSLNERRNRLAVPRQQDKTPAMAAANGSKTKAPAQVSERLYVGNLAPAVDE